jgi:hypothetical protein
MRQTTRGRCRQNEKPYAVPELVELPAQIDGMALRAKVISLSVFSVKTGELSVQIS